MSGDSLEDACNSRYMLASVNVMLKKILLVKNDVERRLIVADGLVWKMIVLEKQSLFASKNKLGLDYTYDMWDSRIDSVKVGSINMKEAYKNGTLIWKIVMSSTVMILHRSGVWTTGQLSSTVPKRMTSEERNMIEILEEHNIIDLARYINFVSARQAGAIATFSGTTRDTFEGKIVLELRYEAYVPMAIRCIQSICSSARSSWNLHSIAVAHRLGPVVVGETSVFVAVSAIHRADALDACKYVIDELKASVPIWKKEVYANGEVWKENSEFLERRLELGKRDGDSGWIKVQSEGHNKKGCCGAKVKVSGEGLANISTSHEHEGSSEAE
ncbi:Molybdopterin synthase catalytic subunit [Morella rubra]|uniref:Molybdopterin synthase catalytic subunit n=1 Tax=Morella rubra TaxID=262757 RepID=A0A6A1WQA4_9ROSI|nr:Molybdopterin synthase catalytic subunit [Morella rubra]